jgi:hypothetical protein
MEVASGVGTEVTTEVTTEVSAAPGAAEIVPIPIDMTSPPATAATACLRRTA